MEGKKSRFRLVFDVRSGVGVFNEGDHGKHRALQLSGPDVGKDLLPDGSDDKGDERAGDDRENRDHNEQLDQGKGVWAWEFGHGFLTSVERRAVMGPSTV